MPAVSHLTPGMMSQMSGGFSMLAVSHLTPGRMSQMSGGFSSRQSPT